MEIRCLDIPLADYPRLQRTGQLGEESCRRVEQALKGLGRTVLLGDGLTARYFRSFLGDSLLACQTSGTFELGFNVEFDVLLVALAPSHYPDILANLGRWFGDRPVRVILPFHRFIPEVTCILESQPRSGTMYTVNNLMRSLGCRYASTHETEVGQAVFSGMPFQYGDVVFDLGPEGDGRHVVLTHFFTRARDLALARDAKRIRLLGYPFDSYYSWAKKLILGYAGDGYVLRNTSSEWRELKKFIAPNRAWLSEQTTDLVLRYEDFAADTQAVAARVNAYLGTSGVTFTDFKSMDRTYSSDAYLERMDEVVFATLRDSFADALALHYPEKLDALYGR